MASVGLHIRWDGVSRNHQGKANDISEIDGDSDVVPACICMLGWGRAQWGNNGFSQHFSMEESYPFRPCPEARQRSSSYMSQMPLKLLPQHWSSKQVIPSARKSVCVPFKRNIWDFSHNLRCSHPEVVGDSLPSTEPWAEEPFVGLGSFTPLGNRHRWDIPPNF